jgi:hypothetical protein
MQLMLESADGAINWPIVAFHDGPWLKLLPKEKIAVLKNLSQGSYKTDTEIKVSSSKYFYF